MVTVFSLASVCVLISLLYILIRQKVVTLGIPKYKQMKNHQGKEWKHEEAIIPLRIGDGIKAQVESEVKWCPETNEIFRKKQNTGTFEEDWEELTRYSDLYKRLLQNFKNKYVRGRGNPGGDNKTDWTTLS